MHQGLTAARWEPYRASLHLMRILVIGGGAREHALAWKLRQSALVKHIWCMPGNAGIAEIAECIAGDISDVRRTTEIAQELKPDITIVGPEQPLTLGVAEEFERRGLRLLGPSSPAARLEGSKIFAKEFMNRHGIPTAPLYGVFNDAPSASDALCKVEWPVVVKADGLCAGKGVLVTSLRDEAEAFIECLIDGGEFGEAGRCVILEKGLMGREVSYIVLTDGESFLPLAPARDYKRIFDGDEGPNTGGMGAISTGELLSAELERIIQETVVRPTIKGLARDGLKYLGFLYFGLMITNRGPKVLEFNCRLGDPETEALVMRMNFDLAAAADAAVCGELAKFTMDWTPAASACVVLASAGYPGKPQTGQKISGILSTDRSDVAIFHAATELKDGYYYVRSGRVLTVAAAAETVANARLAAYAQARRISFDGMQFRRDIGGELESAAGK